MKNDWGFALDTESGLKQPFNDMVECSLQSLERTSILRENLNINYKHLQICIQIHNIRIHVH